ncbi:cytochrome P450, partial [Oryctes borbonicus]
MIGYVEIAIIFVTVGLSVYLYFKRSYSYWKKRKVPYIEPRIPWGIKENPLRPTKSLLMQMKEFYNEFKAKDYAFGGLYFLTSPVLLLVEPELIKKVLSKDFPYFTSHGIHVDEEKEPISGNLFSLDGEKWRNMRIKLTPTFTSGKIKTMYHTMLKCGEPMIEHISSLSTNGKPLNCKEVLACFTTDVIGSCAFGVECNSFKDPDADFRRHGRELFKLTWRSNLSRFINLLFPKLKLPTINKETRQFFCDTFSNIVTHRKKTDIRRDDFVQLMLEINKKAEANGSNDSLNVGQMTAQSIMFFAAGFETSSTTMTFCLHELAHNLDIQERLRNEINATMQKYDGKLTYDGILEMKYLNMVIDETLRKYPAGSLLHRVCTKDYTIEETGTKIQAGTRVFVSILGLQRDPEYFPNPDKFDPERFSDENKRKIRSFTYLPFGEGPRICIGLRFGVLQAKLGLCLLLKNFIFTPHKSL